MLSIYSVHAIPFLSCFPRFVSSWLISFCRWNNNSETHWQNVVDIVVKHMREDGLKWARHDEGDEAGKRGYRSFYVEEKKLLLLIYAPLKCFCSSKKGNNTSVYSMIQNVKRRKDTTRGLFCKTTNKTNGVCFMLSLEVRLYVCLWEIVLLQHIYLESV